MSVSASMSKTSINKQRGLLSLARNRLLDITGKQQQQLQQLQQQHQQQHPQQPEAQQADDELEDIAVVSGAESGQLTYGCGTTTTTTTTAANGPRVVPGIITSSRLMEDRLSSGSRNRSNNPSSLLPGLLETTDSGTTETLLPLTRGTTDNADIAEDPDSSSGHCTAVRNRAFSRHSVFEGVVKSQLNSKRFSPESFSALYVQLADNSHLLDSRKPTGPEKNKVSQKVEHHNGGRDGCNWTFVFDPAGQLSYYWSLVVSLAFLYNFWVLIYRFAFEEINGDSLVLWFCLDYFCDLLYVLDIAFHFRTGYLEEGVLQTDTKKLRHHYLNSTIFYIDSLCLLPLDFMYLSIGFNSMLRCFRLLKIYRFWNFMDRTERHTNYPNLFRTVSLIHYVMVIYHWNACVSHIVMERINYNQLQRVSLFNQTDNRGPLTVDNDVVIKYLRSYYWCTLMMTTMGDLPEPQTKDQYLFVTGQLVFGLMLFASVLGHVSSIVINVSAARKEFQAKLDAVKTYMRMRRVPAHLQVKVIKWFDYLWLTHKSSDEEKAVGGLPDKLKAEIAIHVHLDTLKRVEIFQNTEAGFLCELVLRLKPVLFSPGDYICRKGEVGKEMYIVNRGRLQVVADNGRTVLATLKAGSYFGEISILNMGPAGNRRTASVRSVGYSDLFVLSKKDMWDVLKEYPAARVRLEAIAVKRLEKYKKAPLKKAAMGRSRSTPGLIESRGRVPLERMQLPNNPNWNNKILQQNRQLSVATPSSRSHGSSSSTDGTSTFTSRRSSVLPPASIPSAVIERLSPPGKAKPEAPNLRNDLALADLLTSPWTSVERRSSVQTTLTSAVISAYGAVSGSGVQGRESAGAWLRDAGFLPPEALLSEVNRLRDRLQLLESENLALNSKLRRQQWEVENRLAEIEMQICGAASPVQSPNEDNEQNFESAI